MGSVGVRPGAPGVLFRHIFANQQRVARSIANLPQCDRSAEVRSVQQAVPKILSIRVPVRPRVPPVGGNGPFERLKLIVIIPPIGAGHSLVAGVPNRKTEQIAGIRTRRQ